MPILSEVTPSAVNWYCWRVGYSRLRVWKLIVLRLSNAVRLNDVRSPQQPRHRVERPASLLQAGNAKNPRPGLHPNIFQEMIVAPTTQERIAHGLRVVLRWNLLDSQWICFEGAKRELVSSEASGDRVPLRRIRRFPKPSV